MVTTIPKQISIAQLPFSNIFSPLRKIPLSILLLLLLTLSLLLFPPSFATAFVADVVAHKESALAPRLCIDVIQFLWLPLLKIPNIRILEVVVAWLASIAIVAKRWLFAQLPFLYPCTRSLTRLSSGSTAL